MREGAKEEAGAGTPGFEGGRTWGPGPLGLRGERVGRAEGLDLRRKGLGTGTLGLWKEGGWGPGLPSSLTHPLFGSEQHIWQRYPFAGATSRIALSRRAHLGRSRMKQSGPLPHFQVRGTGSLPQSAAPVFRFWAFSRKDSETEMTT